MNEKHSFKSHCTTVNKILLYSILLNNISMESGAGFDWI